MFEVASRKGSFVPISLAKIVSAGSTHRLLKLRISAWLWFAPITLRSGVAGCGCCLLPSRWLLADAVRQNGDWALGNKSATYPSRSPVDLAIPTQIGL